MYGIAIMSGTASPTMIQVPGVQTDPVVPVSLISERTGETKVKIGGQPLTLVSSAAVALLESSTNIAAFVSLASIVSSI